MSDFNSESFAGFEEEPLVEPSQGDGKKPRNRAFLVIVGILGVIFILALIVLAVVALVILPQRNAARAQEAALINAANTATALFATQMAYAQQELSTPTPEKPTMMAAPMDAGGPTSTPVVVFPTATATIDPDLLETETTAEAYGGPPELLARTQTVAALLTQAAAAPTHGPAATALPTTGFADEVGLPGLFGLAVVLMVVIFFARKMRSAEHG